MSESQLIPTLNRPKRFEFEGGGYVNLRRLKASARDECLVIAKFSKTDQGSQAKAGQLFLRVGIVGGQVPSMEDPEKDFNVERRREPGLGKIATTDTYDHVLEAATEAEYAELMTVVTGIEADDEEPGETQPLKDDGTPEENRSPDDPTPESESD